MKTKMKISMLLLIVITSLFIFSCNTESRGVFQRISESVEKDNVGAVTLMTADSSGNLIAHTYEEGIKTYNPTTKSWSQLIDQGEDLNLLDNDLKTITKDRLASNGTTIYFATSAREDESNNLFEYVESTVIPPKLNPDTFYEIIRMTPTNDLMIIKNNDNTLSVNKPSKPFLGNYVTEYDSSFMYSEVYLLAVDTTKYMLTGYQYNIETEVTSYYHELIENNVIVDTSSSIESMFVAMHHDGTNYVLITNSGRIYYGSNLTSLTEGNVIPLPETSMSFRTLPILHDSVTGKIYIQGESKKLFLINTTDGTYTDVTDDFSSDMGNVEIFSFLSSGTKNFVGTKDNGIIEFTFPN